MVLTNSSFSRENLACPNSSVLFNNFGPKAHISTSFARRAHKVARSPIRIFKSIVFQIGLYACSCRCHRDSSQSRHERFRGGFSSWTAAKRPFDSAMGLIREAAQFFSVQCGHADAGPLCRRRSGIFFPDFAGKIASSQWTRDFLCSNKFGRSGRARCRARLSGDCATFRNAVSRKRTSRSADELHRASPARDVDDQRSRDDLVGCNRSAVADNG